MIYTMTAAGAHGFQPGDQVTITGVPWPRPPYFSWHWPWQDGDRAIFMWLYQLFGWPLPMGRQPKLMLVQSVSTTTLEIK